MTKIRFLLGKKGKAMFEYIKGVVTFVCPYYITIENQGIGYQLAVANPYRYSESDKKEMKIFVHQVIREDAHTLYGFFDLDEKELFLRLIRVSGIGPKSALAILASEDHVGLVRAIESDDAEYLTKFPGVGKKTAQQMILDLKGKLGELSQSKIVSDEQQDPTVIGSKGEKNPALSEAIEALWALGYSEREVKKVVPELEKSSAATTDDFLRLALKVVMKK